MRTRSASRHGCGEEKRQTRLGAYVNAIAVLAGFARPTPKPEIVLPAGAVLVKNRATWPFFRVLD